MLKNLKLFICGVGAVCVLLFGSTAFSAPVYPSFDGLMIPQTGCLPPAVNEEYRLTLMSDDTPQKPLTNQKLLTILIEFNDVEIKYGAEYWSKQMFDTTPGALSVVNYWKENANGLDIFEPAETSGVEVGRKGTASYEVYTDINYEITECKTGVVKVSLDIPHPVKTWNDKESLKDINLNSTVPLALRAIENNFDFNNEQPHIVAIFAGFDTTVGQGEGQGQIRGHASLSDIKTSEDISLGRYAVVGEKMYEDIPEGIGSICHELGHSVFYLPDLYFSSLPSGNTSICMYSLMGIGCWGNRYDAYAAVTNPDYGDPYASKWGHVPAHLDPYCKIKLGYVTPTLVNEWDGDINSISAGGDNSQYNVLEVRSKADSNQYFLIENRQLIGFDKGLEKLNQNFFETTTETGKFSTIEFNGGIVIWHIDENTRIDSNNNCEYHQFMDVEHKDNTMASAWVFTKNRENKFNSETTPNSNFHEEIGLNDNCKVSSDCHPQTVKSGVSIEVLDESNASMRVNVNVDDEYIISQSDKRFIDIFPDVNFCKAVIDMLEEDDTRNRTNNDIVLPRDLAKIMSIPILDLENCHIKDLTGLEYFKKLLVLDVSGNELTEFTIPNCPNLFSVYCGNNKLSKLDVFDYEELRYLDCQNSELIELNIGNCPMLLNLECQNNLLTELDLSKSSLYELYCYNNRLTKLDVSNQVELYRLECYDNYMDTEIPDKSLIGLEPLKAELGEPESKENATQNSWFVYYPQKTLSELPTPTPKTGDRVEFEQSGGKVTAKLIFDSTAPPAESDIMLIVAYSENGQLIRAEIPDITEMTAEFDYRDCDISVYVWDKNMKHLMEVQKLKRTAEEFQRSHFFLRSFLKNDDSRSAHSASRIPPVTFTL